MKSDAKKIFFDVSALVEYVSQYSCYSGIQRVVAVLISEVSKIVDSRILYISFVGPDGLHRCANFSEIGSDVILSPTLMASIFHRNGSNRKHPLLIGYHDRYIKYIFHKLKYEFFYRVKPEGIFKSHSFDPVKWEKGKIETKRKPRLSTKMFSEVSVSGDHLILLDSTWHPRHTKAFIEAKNRELDIHTMVHDLIPIKCSGSVVNPAPFKKWLLDSAQYTTRYLANSNFTKLDLCEFNISNGISHDVGLVPLAQCGLPENERCCGCSDCVPSANHDEVSLGFDHCDRLIDLPPGTRTVTLSPFALCVGTIEARKNMWRLALAWKKMIDNGMYDIPKLVFAGRLGWLYDDLADLLKGTGNIYGYVKIIEGPTDGELRFLYKNCKFTLNVSMYEGWGLPIGESLAYGKTSVVADVASLPEVGGDLVEYCDPHSIDSIHNAVLRLISEPSRLSELEDRIKGANLRSWNDVAKNLLLEILAPAG